MRMPANPSPKNRKLNGNASVRTTARRPLRDGLRRRLHARDEPAPR